MLGVVKFMVVVGLLIGAVFGFSFLQPPNAFYGCSTPTGGFVSVNRGEIIHHRGGQEVKTNGFAFLEDKIQNNAEKEHFSFSVRPMGEEFDLAYFMLEGTQAWMNVMVATNSSIHSKTLAWAEMSSNKPSFVGTNATFLTINFEVSRSNAVLIPFMHQLLSNAFGLKPADGLVFDP